MTPLQWRTQQALAEAFEKSTEKTYVPGNRQTEAFFYVEKDTRAYIQAEFRVSAYLNNFVPPIDLDFCAPLVAYAAESSGTFVCRYPYAGPSLHRVFGPYEATPWEGLSEREHADLQRYVDEDRAAVIEGLRACYKKLHVAELIHGDIKLANVCIHPVTRVLKLVDFENTRSFERRFQNETNASWNAELSALEDMIRLITL